MPASPVNVAAFLAEMARAHPQQRAMVFPTGRNAKGRQTYSHVTFLDLNREVDQYAHGLEQIGIRRGMRTILMVKPGREFFALTFALLKVGAVAVLIDPGMGRQSMVRCLSEVQAEAFIGIPLAQMLRVMHPTAFRSIHTTVTVGRRWLWRGHRLDDLRVEPAKPYTLAETAPDEPAAIIFTTGSTGPPKGVLFRHAMFDAQVRVLRDHFGVRPGEIDLPTFPLFALFDPALGMTAVIPDMDPTMPAQVDAKHIIDTIHDQHVTHMFGSPALLNRVGRYGQDHGVKLPTLRRVITAGAPMPPDTLERFGSMLDDDVQVFTPYGATESLPVASIGSHEILRETAAATHQGKGTCVGRPLGDVTLKIIRITDEPIATWSDDCLAGPGEIGEIAVKGPIVSREYIARPEANRLAKILEGEDVWHRIGDVGYVDESGRVWFCGRKAHRVISADRTRFTVCCEAIFNRHPSVRRSALVGVGAAPAQRPVICVELEGKAAANEDPACPTKLREELMALGRAHDITEAIDTFLVHASFPVDIRHNAKIFREKLAVWAAEHVS